MNLYFRFFIYLIFSWFSKIKLGVFDSSVISFRVLPNDLDLNNHMNNGRFLTIMDIGRIDMVIKTGLGKIMLKNKWYPVVGSVNIIYLKSLSPFQKYNLETKTICWDEKWFYIEQRFLVNDRIIATAIVKALFKKGNKTLSSIDVINAVNPEIKESPEFPEYLVSMQQKDKDIINSIKNNN